MSLQQIMAELRKDYVASMPEKIRNIGNFWTAGKLEELRNEFHKLKGTGTTYGMPEVTSLGLTMEKICKGKPDSLKEAMPIANKALQRIYELRSQNQEIPAEGLSELAQLQKLETP